MHTLLIALLLAAADAGTPDKATAPSTSKPAHDEPVQCWVARTRLIHLVRERVRLHKPAMGERGVGPDGKEGLKPGGELTPEETRLRQVSRDCRLKNSPADAKAEPKKKGAAKPKPADDASSSPAD